MPDREHNLDEAIPQAYADLRRLAAYYLRSERANHTLSPTDLVHETYLRLQSQHSLDFDDRVRFLSVATTMMRRILVNHARNKKRVKRGEGVVHIPLEEAALYSTVEFEKKRVDYIALDTALDKLAQLDRRAVIVVEMRYFAGIDMDDIADVLGVSRSTVMRDWSLAKRWLYRKLNAGAEDDG
ncbi:MAG: sigma-70 family RNA polymerase sigma factor [Acidobacteria bacterium]|nr:sigma-70 family RNA polymerase sigma factor [Acidobacteriota bacterium]